MAEDFRARLLLAFDRVGDRGLLIELLLELGRGLLQLGNLLAQLGGCLGIGLVFLDQLVGDIEIGRERRGLGFQVLGAGAQGFIDRLLNGQLLAQLVAGPGGLFITLATNPAGSSFPARSSRLSIASRWPPATWSTEPARALSASACSCIRP